MTSYTLFSQGSVAPSALAGDATAYSMGVQFSVSQNMNLTAIWFYSSGGAAALPSTIALYAVSGTALIHKETASWSGAAGSGWVRAQFTVAPPLTASVSYKAVVLQPSAVNWYTNYQLYWTSPGPGASGITNGPLSAPNNAGGDGGQDTFNASATLAYPSGSALSSNYWVDPEVTSGIGSTLYPLQAPVRTRIPAKPRLSGVYMGTGSGDTSFGTGQIQWGTRGPVNNPVPGPKFYPFRFPVQSKIPHHTHSYGGVTRGTIQRVISLINTAEGGVAGATATPGDTGGASGNAFDTVTIV